MRIPIDSITLDPALQPRVCLVRETIDEYRTAMEAGEAFPPIVVFGDTRLLADGFHRVTAAQEAGLEEIEVEVRDGDRREAILYSVGANATHGLQRTNADKRKAVDTLVRDPEWSKWSDREIARQCGVHHSTVADRRKSIWRNPPDSRLVERSGTVYEQNTAEIGKLKPRVEYFREDIEPEPEPEPNKWSGSVHASSKSVEHYTPDDVLTLVERILGGIDLDPCADPGKRVPAEQHFTKEDDGLTQEWEGRIFMNPPYGSELLKWVDKLIESYTDGFVNEAIALVPARPGSEWWRALTAPEDVVVGFFDGRLTFVGEGNYHSAGFPSALVYIGMDYQSFIQEFDGIHGSVWQRIGRSE